MSAIAAQPKVWVTQETEHDFSPAEQWGPVWFLTDGDFTNNKNSVSNVGLVRELMTRLQKFNPQCDWLVIAGSPYVSAAVFMLLGRMGCAKVRVLRWDNRDLNYRPMEIQLEVQ